MLGRGAVAGLKTDQFVSGFHHRWRYLQQIRYLQDCHHQAARDIFSYRAGNPKTAVKLTRERLNLLARQIGSDKSFDEIAKERELEVNRDYEKLLLRHYNISRADAARLMDEAMLRETKRYGFRNKR